MTSLTLESCTTIYYRLDVSDPNLKDLGTLSKVVEICGLAFLWPF